VFPVLFFLLIFMLFPLNGTAPASVSDDPVEAIFEIGTVQSLIIQKEDEIIAGYYSGSMNANRQTNIKSASKSVLSLLVGIAIDQGYLEGTDQTIEEFFPDYFRNHPDSRKLALTIRDLLTMRTGLESTSFRNYGRWVASRNWAHYALNQPMNSEPGGEMIYSTGTSHLLSVILTRATGMSSLEFGNQYLFGPMGITIGGWDRDPQGYYMGGNNMAMSPADMIKVGTLIMHMGSYNGEQLVSREWIVESLQVYGRSSFNPYDYGYMWWSKNVNGFKVYFAWGNGGQYIMVLPELESVISITSSLNNSGSRRYQREIFQFLGEVIIPFIKES
jgi:CubicO group peptidase (beta-lactamase class C family)